jgi:hypothetical protein
MHIYGHPTHGPKSGGQTVGLLQTLIFLARRSASPGPRTAKGFAILWSDRDSLSAGRRFEPAARNKSFRRAGFRAQAP